MPFRNAFLIVRGYAYVSEAEPHKERSELSESLRLSPHQAAKPLNDLDCEGSLRYIN
jgi:hypothetical protein